MSSFIDRWKRPLEPAIRLWSSARGIAVLRDDMNQTAGLAATIVSIAHRTPAGRLYRAVPCLLRLACSMALICGCGSSDELQLPVKSVSYWSLPADGARIPAPRAMTVSRDEEIYVVDDAGRVLVYDLAGHVVRQWRMPDSKIGNPEAVCVFDDGRIVIADTHYDQIVFFDEIGTVLEVFGRHGTEPGEFSYPVALTQDDSGNFYVGEYGMKHRIQKFTVGGEFILEFGSHGTEPGQFQRPSGIVWQNGRLYVVDSFNCRVQVFTDRGELEGILGETDKSSQLDYPYDIAKGSDGSLFVVEYRAGRVTRFNASGTMTGRFGTSGRGRNEFLTPWGITTVGADVILVADTQNRRIAELQQ